MMEEFEFPGLRERVKATKAKGRPVSIHQDGNVGSLFPDFIAMGIDAVNPIEPCDDAQDIYALKRAYGDRIALHGNIDLNLLAFGTRHHHPTTIGQFRHGNFLKFVARFDG